MSESDCPDAEPLLRTLCNCSDVDEPIPVADMVLSNVFFSSEDDELLPEAFAVLRFE
jgi:hypothetical protein